MTGKIGKDDAGLFFLQSLEEIGIQAHFVQSDTPTAQVACLVTEDGERTMRTFLGAACEMREGDLDEALFEGPELVHIEGYSLHNGQVTQRALDFAKRHGAKTSFSLASFEIVEHFREILPSLLDMHVDIVFANEAEGHALHGLSPRYCCHELNKLCEIAVVSVGDEGCYVAHNGHVVHCPAERVKVSDTIGAGDLFASGFLHGYLEGLDPELCGKLGCHSGSTIVQIAGARIPEALWPELRRRFGDTKASHKRSAQSLV
jgi:sugar/nucleoside kinase (ribokinase family)